MNGRAIPRRRPIPTLATIAFVGSLAATVAYFAGLVPGVPKTLPTFVTLVMVTTGLFAVAVMAWTTSYIYR